MSTSVKKEKREEKVKYTHKQYDYRNRKLARINPRRLVYTNVISKRMTEKKFVLARFQQQPEDGLRYPLDSHLDPFINMSF